MADDPRAASGPADPARALRRKPGTELKRFGMPQRTTGLKPGKPLERSDKPLQRATPLKAGTKPLARKTELPKVNKARQARKATVAGMSKGDAQKIVRQRSGGWCELRIPGHCLGRGSNFGHRKPEGQGGENVPSNGVRVCGMGNASGCHRYQELNRTEAYEKGWLVHWNDDHRKRPMWMWYRGQFGQWLLDDKGEAVSVESNPEEAA